MDTRPTNGNADRKKDQLRRDRREAKLTHKRNVCLKGKTRKEKKEYSFGTTEGNNLTKPPHSRGQASGELGMHL